MEKYVQIGKLSRNLKPTTDVNSQSNHDMDQATRTAF